MTVTRRSFLLRSLALTGTVLISPAPQTLFGEDGAVRAASPPNWIVQGKVCTMNDQRDVFPDGAVCLAGPTITSVLPSMPTEGTSNGAARVIKTDGIIYPGLIDLHKHITYDIHGPWFPGKLFHNRTEFFFDPVYRRTVENPCRLLVQYANRLNDVCLYAEVKALAGGTTAFQGAAIYDPGYTSHLVRNLEFENFGQDRIHQTIWDVTAESAPALRALMPQLDAWIYHLSEGTDDYAQKRFADLKQFGLLSNKLVAIQAVGLTPAELAEMAEAGATMVWGPLGNLRLYGQTTNIQAAHAAGLRLCLGSEWAPSGSKNLLTDLKVADQYNQHVLGGLLSDRELVEMVTANPAAAIGWKEKAGRLSPGAAADMVVVRQKTDDPYRNLINATEEDIELVFIGGEPVYGDADLLGSLNPEAETLRPRRGRAKALAFPRSTGSGCGSFADLRQRLNSALRFDAASLALSLDRLKVRRALNANPPPVQQEYPFFLGIGDEPLAEEEISRFVQSVFPEGVESFSLDPIFIADDDKFPQVLSDPVLVKKGLELKPYFESLLS